MKKVWIMALVAMVVAGSAMAQMGQGGKGSMCGKGAKLGGLQIGRLLNDETAAKQAGITEDQLAALRDAQYKVRNVQIDLRAKREKARLELDKAMDAPKPDKTEIEKLIDQAGQVDIEIRKTMVNLQLEVREILGEEKYSEWVSNQRNNGHGWDKGRAGKANAQMRMGRKACPMMNAPDDDESPESEDPVEE